VFTGEASWYGPGFVGRPTASGAPYDPERFTAAMLLVPLGTVVRVSTADGRAVTVLVNDRGPYAGGSDRILDMSAAGARVLGYTGVKQVRIEVLEPLG
jgi:rare lipoprotein A